MNDSTVESILIGRGKTELRLLGSIANRHGLIAGATGTGKTATLRVLAEGFSAMGVPVFLSDVKGDLSGLAKPGEENSKIKDRLSKLQLKSFTPMGFPVVFWDVFGTQGHPVRTTVSEMGPLLLSRLFELNETQSAVLSAIFKIADDSGLLLLDLKDLKAMVSEVAENADEYQSDYGNITKATTGSIQRAILVFEEQGGEKLFGEPAIKLEDLIRTDSSGRGQVNILASDKLMEHPRVYSMFLLWLLSELFEELPEIGDCSKPKIVFFFDEAHLVFDEAPKALLDKIEQLVRLIRSKGVGVYFITQSPLDIPESILGQLGNRVQHALRAFTPKDQKAVKTAAQTFRTDASFDVSKAITELQIGEALISLLDENGTPGIVERSLVAPPTSNFAPMSAAERRVIIEKSTLFGHYEEAVDRESAYELLRKKAAPAAKSPESVGRLEPNNTESVPRSDRPARASTRQSPMEAFISSTARSVGRQLGQQLMRGIMGSLLGGSKSRR